MKMYSHFSKNREKIDFRFAQYGKGTFERTVQDINLPHTAHNVQFYRP